MIASDIQNLLASRHSKDIYVKECKNGSTYFTDGLLKLDGWAMKRSWAHPLTTGYEIKVNRNDFLRDDKWPGYLNYCNQFYFVCPAELIHPNEISGQAGLLWVSKNARLLHIKKKAPYREIEIPQDLFIYILMCRTKIVSSTLSYDGANRRDVNIRYWKDWLAKKLEDRNLGYRVSEGIRETVKKKILDVQAENERLRREIESLMDIREFCARLGINDVNKYAARNLIQEAAQGMPTSFLRNLDDCIGHLQNFRKKMEQ